MIYICTETTPSYRLNYEHQLIDNNLCSFSDQYRHLRGMWQLYHYTDCPDEIGIFQKRRYILINKIPENFDVVVPECIWPCTIRDQYIACGPSGHGIHAERDINLIESIIADQSFSDYIRIKNNPECYWHNMFIMKRDDFKKYCEFMFMVLFEKDRHVGPQSNCFLAERIGSWWIWKNFAKEKIYAAQIAEFPKITQ